ncbi:S-adenosyl-L-methionine-dependent methyltransferase [Phaeosphaeria sp. MPI-PUGE-AT-0046c]|nr:S-adenosyl-L-methionine-dependent methyltransferase [Phaeosphaeria sp. MPI-PUGE-AT-0046c]
MPPPPYSQGHSTAVTANHVIRTAEHDGAFLLPYLKPQSRILDLGCGPGTITTGFAAYVPEGSVTGIDLSSEVLEQAREILSRQPLATSKRGDINFEVGNVLEGLPFPDASFDAIFTNQTIIHIPEPVKALKELKRLSKPGGLVACREGDFPFRFYPEFEGMQLFQKYLWLMVHGSVSPSNPTNHLLTPDPNKPYNSPHPPNHRSGSLVHVWAREAGFDPEKIVKGASVELGSTKEKRNVFADNMLARFENVEWREKWSKLGASTDELETVVRDLKRWKEDVDSWYAITNCETVCFA